MDNERLPLRVTYDADVDASYLYFADEPRLGFSVSETIPVDPAAIGGMVNLDVDHEGRLIGIEVLGASSLLPHDLLAAVRRRQPKPPAQDAVVHNELDVIRTMLDEAWRLDIVPLRVSERAYCHVEGPLMGYPSGALLRGWCVDHLLAGCRRLLDSHKDSISVRRAVDLLTDLMERTDADVILSDGKTRSGETHPPIRKADVQVQAARDKQTLQDLGQRVKDLATRCVAHRSTRPVEEVTLAEVRELLDAVAEIHRQWALTLRGVDVDAHVDHLTHTTSMARALRLYDHTAYVEALDAERRRLGPASTVTSQELNRRLHVEYHFGT